MQTSHGRLAARCAILTSSLVLFAAAPAVWSGCKSDSAGATDPFLSLDDGPRVGGIDAPDSYATQPLDAKLLANDDWHEKPPRSYAERKPYDRLWHHPALDPYLHPKAPRRDLSDELLSTSPVVATNAAIVSVHWRTGKPVEHLAAAVRSEKLPLPMRCAAAEALGAVEKPSPAPLLRALLGEVAPPEPPQPKGKRAAPPRQLPDLHAELIRALARHAGPEDESWFTAALANRAWKVRLEGMAAWSALVDLSLPPQAIELREDHDPRVRAAAMLTIAAHRDPRSLTWLQQGLGDADPDVRKAAMLSLEQIGTADARALVSRAKARGADVGPPSPPVQAMIGFNYYAAERAHPCSVLGMLYVLEVIASVYGGKAADAIARANGRETSAGGFRFLSSHATMDADHMAKLNVLLKTIEDPAAQAAVVNSTRVNFHQFGQLFTDEGFASHLAG